MAGVDGDKGVLGRSPGFCIRESRLSASLDISTEFSDLTRELTDPELKESLELSSDGRNGRRYGK